jgi:hypothetical protein
MAASDPQISIHTSDPSASAVASVLYRVDVALRRAIATSRSEYLALPDQKREGRPGSLPKPLQTDRGGFVITSASEGTLDLVGHFFGEAVQFLNSDAAEALERLMTFLVLGGGAWKFLVGRNNRNDPRGPLPIANPRDIKGIIRTSQQGGGDVEVIARLKQRKSETEIVIRVEQPTAGDGGSS